MIVPIVIGQTPVCDRLGLDGEVVGKRARILIHQITVGCVRLNAPASATTALDRISIPQEVFDRFSDSAWVGSSLIISDEDLNKETGPATDFIVVSSNDLQGGLKMRKPEPPKIERAARRFNVPSRSANEDLMRHPLGGLFSW